MLEVKKPELAQMELMLERSVTKHLRKENEALRKELKKVQKEAKAFEKAANEVLGWRGDMWENT